VARIHTYVLAAAATFGLLAASCGDDNSSSAASTASVPSATTAVATTAAPATSAPAPSTTTAAPATSAAPTVSGDVTVFAASSLTAAFTAIGDAFKTANPDANVKFNFAASSDLVTQIDQGAAADVYASADQANMQKLVDAAANADQPQVFATNSLQIIVPPGNPKGIKTLSDLANPNILYVTCAPEVPIGKYAAQALSSAGVTVTPVSLEQNVKGIVTKVTLGEADAGIVYTTDVIAAGQSAQGIDIPTENNVIATYPIVAVKAAPNPEGAAAFKAFVISDQGQKILAGYGFTSP